MEHTLPQPVPNSLTFVTMISGTTTFILSLPSIYRHVRTLVNAGMPPIPRPYVARVLPWIWAPTDQAESLEEANVF
jgi:hypothetical protein